MGAFLFARKGTVKVLISCLAPSAYINPPALWLSQVGSQRHGKGIYFARDLLTTTDYLCGETAVLRLT
jgi:hypothetical protein